MLRVTVMVIKVAVMVKRIIFSVLFFFIGPLPPLLHAICPPSATGEVLQQKVLQSPKCGVYMPHTL